MTAPTTTSNISNEKNYNLLMFNMKPTERKIIQEHIATREKAARIEGALFALDNETLWQYQRKCNAGEARKANRQWLVDLLERNIAKYKAKLEGEV